MKQEGAKVWGIGVGTGVHTNGFELEGGVSAIVRVHRDGSAVAHFAAGRMGNNAETTLMQVMAEELGFPQKSAPRAPAIRRPAPGRMVLLLPIPPSVPVGAVRQAAKDAKRQILEIASQLFYDNASIEHLTIEDGIVQDRNGNCHSVPEVMNTIRPDQLSDVKCIVGRTFGKMPPSCHFARQFAAQFCEVCVDTETGDIQLTDYLAVQNSGVVLNPAVMRNQVFGGVMAGAGFVLKEEMIFDPKNGKVLNPGLTDYKLMRMKDFPAATADVIFVEDECPVGPFGAAASANRPSLLRFPASTRLYSTPSASGSIYP